MLTEKQLLHQEIQDLTSQLRNQKNKENLIIDKSNDVILRKENHQLINKIDIGSKIDN